MEYTQEGPKQSKYLKFFTEQRETIEKESELTGDILVIERIVFGDKQSKWGIVIPDSAKIQASAFTSEKPEFYRVLHVGKGFYDDVTKEDLPIDVKQGDVVMCASASVKLWSSIPLLQNADSSVVGIVSHSSVQWRWHGEEAFLRFLNNLNIAVTSN